MAVKLRKYITVIVLMMIGSAVLASQISQPIATVDTKAEVTTTDQDSGTDSDEAQLIVNPDLSIHSATEVNLDHELYQIREILLDEVADPHVIHIAQKLTESDHFRTLFQHVISVNAP